MQELLLEKGVQLENGLVFEYDDISIAWFNLGLRSTLEIEVGYDEGVYYIEIVLSPEVDGIIERSILFYTSFREKKLAGVSMISKLGAEGLGLEGLTYMEEHNAYILEEYGQSKAVLQSILDCIPKNAPDHIADLNKLLEEDISYESGETLEHFVAMLNRPESADKAQIENNIWMGIEFEGEQYLDHLQFDAANYSGDKSTVMKDFDEKLKLRILSTILNFEKK